ncbi:MAG: PD40 domain-containing protein [Bacteroidales bacterium]|nr:PD40 domain-containing protein [Bacteroidales bacterium]
MKTLKTFLIINLLLVAVQSTSGQVKGYYRYPAIHGETVIFTSEGDLWKYSLTTNETKRLTTNQGVESHARISPDGKWIAFVAQYEGPSEVYVIPIDGGRPKRLTYEESGPIIYQWTADGSVLYSTTYYSTIPNHQLVKINPVKMTSEIIPLSQADQGTYSPSGTLFFTRLRDQGSHTKRYKGGTAQTLWKFDGTNEAEPLTADYPGTSKNPMYYNERIYFLTDRDGTMNIWSMGMDGKDLKQHTKITRWDLEDADLYNGKIVCQQGADLMLFDISSGKSTLLDISLNSDFDQKRVQWISDPKSKLTSADLSYTGNHVVLTSRGRVFSVPVETERWSEVTRKYGIRYKSATYINKENDLMMLSDESGEFEIWKADNYGFNAPIQLTRGSKNFIEDFLPSPDGKHIVFNEKDNRLMLYSGNTGISSVIATNDFGFSGPFSWSPDSRWIAYTDRAPNLAGYIMIYDIKTAKSYQVTTDRQENYTPRFSRDGNWLYFLSERDFKTSVRSPWGNRQPEPYYAKTSKIYAIALDSAAVFPFCDATELSPVKPDTTKTVADKKIKKKSDISKTKPEEKNTDLTSVGSNLYTVPMKTGNIGKLELNNDWLYWSDYNEEDNAMSLNALKITNKKNNEAVNIASGIYNFSLSGDGKKILIRDKTGIMVLNADGSKPDAKKDMINLTKWAFNIDPVEDWKQMFRDAWRMERDYFYDKNMHGVDWQAVYDQYAPLVDRVTDRYELDDLLAHMISELSALHMFVYGGDKRTPKDNISNGYLGARLTRAENFGGYAIDYIYRSDPDFPSELSPLAKPELKIRTGDIITAVNGINTLDVPHINELLVNKADVQVRLKLKNQKGESFDEVIKPLSASEFSDLRYNDWEYSRRLEVDKTSGNRIGYLHLRAMGGGDYDDFVKSFYPAIGKEGLIIDMRHNRGGNIDSWVLEKLMRKAWFYWAPRVGKSVPNMQYAFTGHMVVLMDQHTASDGEAFSEGFRRLGLGKLIGERTWGGEIWLSSGNRLVDNGIATAAETGVYSPEGEWLIEGWGVEPDMKVDNLPFETFKGKDAQMEAAVQYLLKLIKEKPVVAPPIPKYPDKSFKYQENK